jgi:L-rhamnose mutarotase|tara:strand:- start:1971 stop:2312 length:342 start_codon:yes stop_codon:yes gene_type:complete
MKKRLCYSCDLKNESKLINEYKEYHAKGKAWPEITQSIKDSGIEDMEIYLIGNRMFMIIEVNNTFDPIKKYKMDSQNPFVQKWEEMMEKYQQRIAWADSNEKWVPMNRIFKLE